MQELRGRLLGQGANLVGFAGLAPVPEPLRRGFPRAVVFGLALPPAIVAAIAEGPTAEYRATYDALNARLSEMAREAAAWLLARGWRAEARPSTGDIDWQTIRAPFSHKMAATLSGLGWIGKSDLLITPQFGAAVRWVTVLTDAPLECGAPITESRCGSCRACVDACPGHAPSGKPWRQGLARGEFWDPRACMAGTKKINEQRQLNLQVCGMCIAACPFTQTYIRRHAGGNRGLQ
jgi:epoxyqueuosine reductase QueG